MWEIEFDPFALLAAICVIALAIGGLVGPVSYWWILEHYWQPILSFLGIWSLAVIALAKIMDWYID
ncbi:MULTISPECIES: hypothetical protein [Acidithiobacillus]|uniref:Uncharacterized protein n=2 Tax=Acidithiobacillus TaxID=119977 RepID=A0A179BE93_ACIFR|nr:MULTISPECIES: hypothetical protein [Acidithiobacillus]MEB8487348.1 hypothetical protein [Acidithiobacillus ferriphilus]MEB8489897.1 hypothetical protein [Acidithiobacillus ferriphilus]MEB8492020.1 hypothetical protein [Acidithiobacillus ferriphilus]MEB8513613.1 hypothetical protein [Acidithiobacillus ferriphilus]MEB8522646.1 hypothetical protein [Acidithiobacillus ferriphilus]